MSPQRYERVRSSICLTPEPLQAHSICFSRSITDSECLQISDRDHEDDPIANPSPRNTDQIPSSPPPSFRSRTSSPSSRHLLSSEDPLSSEADRILADAFDDDPNSDHESNDGDDRQRLMRGNTTSRDDQNVMNGESRPQPIQRTITEFPGVGPLSGGRTRGTPYSTFTSSNDGVFANLNAKPERGEKEEEEKPPVSCHDYQPLHCISLNT